MIKTQVTPQNADLHIALPPNYIGRKLEVILYAVDEPVGLANPGPQKKRPSDYAGSLSKQEAEKMLKHIEQSRNEWERDI